MKRIILTVLILACALASLSQHPIGNDSLYLQTVGNSQTLFKSKGVIGSDSGIVVAEYPDTASANFGKIKNYPGAHIRVGDSVWMRNSTATQWLNQSSGSSSSGTLLSIAPIGSSPNANGMTLSSNVLNLEPASRDFGGVITASNTPEYIQGQKGWFSNTDTNSSYYGNEVLRSYLTSGGIQRWFLNDGAREVGSASISTPLGGYYSGVPGGIPGIHFNDPFNKSRSQLRLFSGGGLSLGAMDSNTIGIPGTQILLRSNGKVIITGRTGDYTSGESYIVDSSEQGLLNVYGDIRSTDLLGGGNVIATPDGVLAIGSGGGSESDSIALSKTVTVTGSSDVPVTGGTQTISSNPSFTLGNVNWANGFSTYDARYIPNGLNQPGYVTWSGTGLTFDVTPAIYTIDGVRYTSSAGSITLDAADPTNPRYDVIAVDNTGTIIKITGTASANPSIPQVDPATQILLTSIFVDAGATTPVITEQVVYDENTEAWTGTSTGVTVNFTNTSNTQHGTISADVSSWTAGQQLNFTKNSGTVTATDYGILTCYIKLKTALASTGNIRVSFLNGTTVVSSVVTLGAAQGFTKSSTSYQTIAIPISSFTFTSTTVNKIRITLAGTGGGFYLDYLRLQSGISQTAQETDQIALAKTVSINPGYGIIIPEAVTQQLSNNPSHTPTVDTFAIETRARGLKIIDSAVHTIKGTDTVNVSNVLSYGADTTGATDATSQIIQAINNASVTGKLSVYLPHGRYLISVSALKASSQVNHQGIQLLNNINLYGDGEGKTYLIPIGDLTGDTTTTNYYSMINGIAGVSNVQIHDLSIIGKRTSFAIYNSNPYSNTRGHWDTSKRQTVNGINLRYGNNNRIYNVSIDSAQGFGIELYSTTNFYVDNVTVRTSGNEAITFDATPTSANPCSGAVTNSVFERNNADQLSSYNSYGRIKVSKCYMGFSGSSAGASNWFAGAFATGSTNLSFDDCEFYENSAYGGDIAGVDTTLGGVIFNKCRFYRNGNAGLSVSGGAAKVTNNWFYKNGKKSDGSTDTHSNYNPAAIVVANATKLIITGNHSYDTAGGVQAYFIKKWGGGGISFGFIRSIVKDNIINDVADTAHAYDGNAGYNEIDNLIINSSGQIVSSTTTGYVWTYNPNGTGWASSGAISTPPAGSNTEVQFNNSGVFGSSSNFTYSSPLLTLTDNSIATTTTPVLSLTNTTASTSGVVRQKSPALNFHGTGMPTSLSGSQTSDWYIENDPQQSSSNIFSNLNFIYSHNGGSKTTYMTLQSGNVTNALLTITHMNASTNLQTPAINGVTTQNLTLNTNSKLFSNGDLYLGGGTVIGADAGYKLDVQSEAQIVGALNVKKFTSPATPATQIVGTPGTTTISYKLVPRMQNGTTGDPVSVTVTTANATLTTSNWVNLTNVGNTVTPPYAWDVYRISTNGTSPTTTGKIQSVITNSGSWVSSLFDKGAAGDGTTPPTVNTTSNITAAIYKYSSFTSAQIAAIVGMVAGDTVYCSDCTANDASTGVVQTYNGSAWKNNW